RWQVQGAGHATAPVVASSTLFEVHDHELDADDAATGTRRFSVSVDAPAAPAVQGGVLAIVSTDGYLRAYRPDSGEVYWSLDAGLDPSLSPVFAGGTVYAAAAGPSIEGFDAVNGVHRFHADLPGGAIATASPSVAGRLLYVPLSDGSLVALDASTGDLRWS